jgi:hypothetical protein
MEKNTIYKIIGVIILLFASVQVARAFMSPNIQDLIKAQESIMETANKTAELSREEQLKIQGEMRSLEIELEREIEKEMNQKKIYDGARQTIEGLSFQTEK